MKCSNWTHHPVPARPAAIQSIHRTGATITILLKRQERDGRFTRLKIELTSMEALGLAEELRGNAGGYETVPIDTVGTREQIEQAVREGVKLLSEQQAAQPDGTEEPND
jgi:hypothetical protein